MTDTPKLYGIKKADGSISQSPFHVATSPLHMVVPDHCTEVEVEIVRKGTLKLRMENVEAIDRLIVERAAIVARLEAIQRAETLGEATNMYAALLSDLKAGKA